MRVATIATGFALAAALAALLPRAASSQDAAGPEEVPGVESTFRRQCASCHAVPDRALRTDRAWLDQVRRTA